MRAIIVAGMLVALSCCPAKADIPVPGPRPKPKPAPVPEQKSVPVKIFFDENAKEPRIQVPPNLTTLRVQPFQPGVVPTTPEPNSPKKFALPSKSDGIQPGDPMFADDLKADVSYESDLEGQNVNHLMIAGVALTMGLGCGGVWLLRRPNSSSVGGIVVLLASGAVLGGSTLLWANSPPPPRPPVEPKIDLPLLAEGKFKLEILPRGETINIILDKATREKLQKKD